jgi:hypothetical protein
MASPSRVVTSAAYTGESENRKKIPALGRILSKRNPAAAVISVAKAGASCTPM